MEPLGGQINNPIDLNENERSGYSVSLSSDGTILAIGAYGIHSTNDDVGAVFVYQYNGSSWTLLGRIDNPNDLNDDEHFGISVSLSSDGTILAIGANGIHSFDDNNLDRNNVGAVFVYQYNGSSWTL